MSGTAKARLSLLIASAALATIAACSAPTSPTAPLERTDGKTAADRTCKVWVVINGVPTCTEWEEE
jgi:hypothetical protein